MQHTSQKQKVCNRHTQYPFQIKTIHQRIVIRHKLSITKQRLFQFDIQQISPDTPTQVAPEGNSKSEISGKRASNKSPEHFVGVYCLAAAVGGREEKGIEARSMIYI